jgi:IS30 family transposase
MEEKANTIPDKRTPELEEIVLESLRKALPLELAAHAAMVTPQSVYNWIREDETFRKRCEHAKQCATNRLVGLTEAKDPWKILKNQASKHFKDIVETKVDLRYTEEVETTEGDIEKV